MDLGFTVRILREGGTFVAHVPELDVSSCGDTEADSRRNIADAVQGFLETAEDQGTLSDILHKAGYQFEDGRWARAKSTNDGTSTESGHRATLCRPNRHPQQAV